MTCHNLGRVCTFVVALLAAGCAATPMGPTVQVLPSPGKPLDMFVREQDECKAYAAHQVEGSAQRANNMQALTAFGGAAFGAGLGALIGGGHGAAIGASAGAVGGLGVGAIPVRGTSQNIQVRYNQAYEQCMATHGDMLRGYQNAAAY